MVKLNVELIINLANLYISNINKYLKNIKSDIIANFICSINNKLIITINKLANTSDLNIIEKYIKNIQNINLNSINYPYLPKSKSYLKIVGLSHITEQDIINSDIIKGILKKLHLFKDISRLKTIDLTYFHFLVYFYFIFDFLFCFSIFRT